MRKLNYFELENTSHLAKKGINFGLLEPTQTGLRKSIMDATAHVRHFFKKTEIHNYEFQKQGQDYKRIIETIIVSDTEYFYTKTSLYRPETKKGDPRLWIYGLSEYVSPNEILALIKFETQLVVINISKYNIDELYFTNSLMNEIIDSQSLDNSVAEELLGKLKNIAKMGWIVAERADTMIGRTLESLLGIQINPDKDPDYKGIELKSFRDYSSGRRTRLNLFASVPNWNLSNLKSSREILETFGYERDGVFRLYCTISTQTFNSQGLKFRIDEDQQWLIEYCNDMKIGDVAVWVLESLHKRLLHKHNETFWVSAKSEKTIDHEYFSYTDVTHTQKPVPSQFDLLLLQGAITMDHLIKRNASGSVREKGPLFKIEREALKMLFPEVGHYNLLE